MYDFIDTIEVSEGAKLPSEALQINGEFIENLIKGYRTLHVSGREALAPELTTFETGARDGSTLQSKRYPARTIIVTYQLITQSAEEFREAYNELGRILDVKDAELIFNDELDKFYKGTPMITDGGEPGKNAVIGEIEIYCADPFKYSVVEYEAEPWSEDPGTVLVDYNGTYKAYPTLEASFYGETDVADDGETAGTLTGNGDCGYVAFFNETEKIIQLGDPDEADEEEAYKKSQTLFNQKFESSGAWGTKAKSYWATNSGVVMPSGITQAGSLAMKIASRSVESVSAATSGTLLKTSSTAGAPTFNYTVKAKATDRTANSAKVTFTITAALGRDSSYFGKGYGLKASVYVNGAWKSVTLKTTSERWEGKSGHTKNISVTVTGLTASQTSLTGIQFKVERTDSLGNAGKLSATKCSNLKLSAYTEPEPDTYYLAPPSYGTASGKYHGPTITRTLPADASGEVGAENFTLTFSNRMSIGMGKNDTKQLGAFQIQITDADGAVIAGVRFLKNKNGKEATVTFYVNGKKAGTTTLDVSFAKGFANNGKSSKITKSGSKVTFVIAGGSGFGGNVTFIDESIAEMVARKVTIGFEQYSTTSALMHNGLYWVKFVKNNCETMRDVPNKFSANDVVQADCRDGEIYLNGIKSPELGALGNDWEGFYLRPGLNQIGLAYSEWVAAAYAPTFKVKYREVYL